MRIFTNIPSIMFGRKFKIIGTRIVYQNLEKHSKNMAIHYYFTILKFPPFFASFLNQAKKHFLIL